jgi:hypothetical protein
MSSRVSCTPQQRSAVAGEVSGLGMLRDLSDRQTCPNSAPVVPGGAGYPGRGGGLWLRMVFPVGLVTWLVPSGKASRTQPSWWSTT